VEFTDLVRSYIKRRDDFVSRIATLSQELNLWTDEHIDTAPTLTDIARFEALRAERSRLLSEFTEAEDDFIVRMLQNLGSSSRTV
jgi:hypothetical protein